MAAAYCEEDFNEAQIFNVWDLGLTILAYVKGVPVNIDINNTTIDTALNSSVTALWEEYQKSKAYDALQNIITGGWIIGACEISSGEISLRSPTALSIELIGDREVAFTVNATSHLEVSGYKRWKATAKLLSGFSMSLELEKNELVGQENTYCCTKPAGIYQTSTFHPFISGDNYREEIGGNLAGHLGCCFPIASATGNLIIGENDRDVLIGDNIDGCGASVNFSLIDGGNTIHPFSNTQIRHLPLENQIIIEGVNENINYRLQVYSIDGRILLNEKMIGSHAIPVSNLLPSSAAGVYIVRISSQKHSVTQKIFIK